MRICAAFPTDVPESTASVNADGPPRYRAVNPVAVNTDGPVGSPIVGGAVGGMQDDGTPGTGPFGQAAGRAKVTKR